MGEISVIVAVKARLTTGFWPRAENGCLRMPNLLRSLQGYWIMNIASAIFDRSAPDLGACPDESLPEFAFIGRSNVGKSSLLNLLAGKDKLARVSPTPGFTKLINFFTINKRWRLVDLPGYGYAHVARENRAEFNQAVGDYLEHRPNLLCVFALIDSGLTPQPIDLEFVEWLAIKEVPFVLVFTKTDKNDPATAQANIAAFKERISEWCEKLPEVYTCSAKLGQGRQDLLGVVSAALAEQASAPVVEAPAPPPAIAEPVSEGLDLRVAANRTAKPGKSKPSKSQRPW
jgi:GTP-binding protein